MTYMPADNPRNQQQQLDIKFHEYKLAALTGLMTGWDPKQFSESTARMIAAVCELVAQSMEKMDEVSESGDGP